MLFLVERSRVKTVSGTEQRESDIREVLFSRFAHWKTQQLDNRGFKEDGRLPNAEQLVYESKQNDKAKTDDPGANG